jgi:hypothetical protein
MKPADRYAGTAPKVRPAVEGPEHPAIKRLEKNLLLNLYARGQRGDLFLARRNLGLLHSADPTFHPREKGLK